MIVDDPMANFDHALSLSACVVRLRGSRKFGAATFAEGEIWVVSWVDGGQDLIGPEHLEVMP